MSYAIMRLQKIKSKSALAGIERHDRYRDVLMHRKHAERAVENKWLQNKYYDRDEGLIARFERLTEGCPKWRKDAVLAFEVVMAYSPDAEPFIDANAWIKSNLRWLSDSFGGAINVIGAFYHADETTPHMHAVVVPVVHENDTKKLSAYHYVHGKQSLSLLQDSYADAMAPYDLQRGNKSTDNPEKRVYHSSLREYWAEFDAKEAAKNERIVNLINEVFEKP